MISSGYQLAPAKVATQPRGSTGGSVRGKTFFDHGGPDRIATHVDRGPETVQQPIDREDQPDIFHGQAHRIEDNDHSDQAGFRDSRRPDRCHRCRHGHHDLLREGQLKTDGLGDEDSRYGLMRGCVRAATTR